MVSLYDAILDAAQGGICDLVDLSERIAPPQPLRRLDLLEPARRQFRNFLASKFCNKPFLPPPQDFFGGRCPQAYRVNAVRVIRFWDERPDRREVSGGFATGPIASISPGIVSSGGGVDVTDLIVVNDSGQEFRVGGAVNIARTPANGPFREVQWINVVLTNLQDPSDACGNVDFVPPYDPQDFTFTNIVNYTNNEGDEFSIPITFVVGVAYLDADLNVNVPVDVKIAPSIDPVLNFDFDLGIDFNISTGGEKWRLPRDPELPRPLPPVPPDSRPDAYDTPDAPPPPPPDAPDPPDEPPERRTRRVIKAALVTVIEETPGGRVGRLFQDENPDIAVPNYGYINFLCRATAGAGGWTPDQAVKNGRCFIPCPWEGGAYDVKGTPQPGIRFVVTPVYGEIPLAV